VLLDEPELLPDEEPVELPPDPDPALEGELPAEDPLLAAGVVVAPAPEDLLLSPVPPEPEPPESEPLPLFAAPAPLLP
jgi:hypothetical protein